MLSSSLSLFTQSSRSKVEMAEGQERVGGAQMGVGQGNTKGKGIPAGIASAASFWMAPRAVYA